MSISTQRGDNGYTSLIGGERMAKSHLRLEVLGCLDEFNAALGLARGLSQDVEVGQWLKTIQQKLFAIGTVLATPSITQSMPVAITADNVAQLTAQVHHLEATEGILLNWSIPGDLPATAAIDLARTACRRLERWSVRLQETGEPLEENLLPYLNRLSDWLWLIGRWVELKVAE